MTYPKAVVAMVQMGCDGTSQHMLHKSVAYVEEAASKGARLVVFPECFPTDEHTKMDCTTWDTAEPWEGGRTEVFYGELAKRLQVYICTTVVLVQGLDFYNTAVMMAPSGKCIAKIRKNYTTGFEAFYLKRGSDKHIVDTPDLGKIAVGISADNYFNILTRELFETSVSLVVSPHSVPDPRTGAMAKLAGVADMLYTNYSTLSRIYSETFGCPAAFINKVGTVAGTTFGGMTSLSAGGGKLLACVPDGEEGIAMAEVELIPSRTGSALGKNYKDFETTPRSEMNPIVGKVSWKWQTLLDFFQGLGGIYYSCSLTRRQVASKISGTSTLAPSYEGIAIFCLMVFLVAYCMLPFYGKYTIHKY